MTDPKHTHASPSPQEPILIRTRDSVVWFGTYVNEDSRWILLAGARRVTPDYVAAMEISHIANDGIHKALPPIVDSVRVRVIDVAEIITPTPTCVESIQKAARTATKRETELEFLTRSQQRTKEILQSDTYGT